MAIREPSHIPSTYVFHIEFHTRCFMSEKTLTVTDMPSNLHTGRRQSGQHGKKEEERSDGHNNCHRLKKRPAYICKRVRAPYGNQSTGTHTITYKYWKRDAALLGATLNYLQGASDERNRWTTPFIVRRMIGRRRFFTEMMRMCRRKHHMQIYRRVEV